MLPGPLSKLHNSTTPLSTPYVAPGPLSKLHNSTTPLSTPRVAPGPLSKLPTDHHHSTLHASTPTTTSRAVHEILSPRSLAHGPLFSRVVDNDSHRPMVHWWQPAGLPLFGGGIHVGIIMEI
ncbi:hypothetical protein Pcinc_027315 [Petrolisthes cinctipes]|uniref:Uncharacterized protein n=1 Tax=Petrolisthes cinctipes TaxID=88211 RepID=A0AAE1F683_PETCI|nr:hypothetical protein Pcinc_027315 [Petrolisthes cinctipes]